MSWVESVAELMLTCMFVRAAGVSAIQRWLDANMNVATLSTYESSFNVYRRWCEEGGKKTLPADPVQLAEYVAWLGEEVKDRKPPVYAASSIIKHVSAVKHFHVAGAHPSLSSMVGYELLEKVVKVAKGRAVQATPKEALLLEDLDKLCEVLSEGKEIAKMTDLMRVRAGCALFLLFIGGFRVGELVKLKWGNLLGGKMDDVQVEYLDVAVERRKNDKRGQKIVIPSIDKPWNPVRWVLRLKELALKRKGVLPTYVFNNTQKVDENVHIVTGTVNAWVKKWVGKAGMDAKKYGTHSGRRGGATALARAGASAGEIKAFGGWKSDTFKRYIQEMPDEKKNAALLLKKAADGKELKASGVKKGGGEARKELTAEQEAKLDAYVGDLNKQMLELLGPVEDGV